MFIVLFVVSVLLNPKAGCIFAVGKFVVDSQFNAPSTNDLPDVPVNSNL